MLTKREIYERAQLLLQTRRQEAEASYARRTAEAERKVPKIKPLRDKMSSMSLEISRSVLSRHIDAAPALEHLARQSLEIRREITMLLTNAGFPVDYLERRPDCAICGDTGVVETKRCSCLERIAAKVATDDFNADSPLRLINSGVGFDESKVPPEVMKKCRAYVNSFNPGTSPSLLMIGNPGLGKTWLSMWIASELLAKSYIVTYARIGDLLVKIADERFSRGGEEERHPTMDAVLNADLLIIDDWGQEFDTAINHSILYDVIAGRVSVGLPIIANTNLDAKKLGARYSDALISRVVNGFELIHFPGNNDMRAKKTTKKIISEE